MMDTSGHRTLVRAGDGLRLEYTTGVSGSARPGRRILRVGVCGTDRQILRGARGDQARVLGHEGIADTLTDGGRRWCEIFNPVDPIDQDAILGHSYDGLLQDRLPADCPVGTIAADLRLPVDFGPLVEPAATAVYAWELLGPHLRTGDRVSVFGGGSAAVLLAMAGEDLGYRIQLIHPRPERLSFLAHSHLLPSTEFTTTAASGTAAGAVVCLPREAAHDGVGHAVDALTDGGVLDLFGGIPAGFRHRVLPGIDAAGIRRANVCGNNGAATTSITVAGKTVHVTGHRGTAPRHLESAQQRLLAGITRYAGVITHVISLEEAVHRIPAMARGGRSGSGEYLKVVVDLTMARPHRAADPALTVADQVRSPR
ncbi:hypothetical protein [Nocardia sp. alder85J]|uniref:hypothetical protein n=1 Tax=Nocardia sp. alder85J TaxID=2862949 RepID=UPI001CD3410F|nr:hypothetical protein [Nocardia sp. alder85J]MCX4097929.1 hypothetical protein [Nocardia sp. alder85J]